MGTWVGIALSAWAGGPAVAAGAASAPAPNAEVIARGEYLANAGDCIACHSAKGGKPLAGGLSIETPYGTIPAPNITPDKETGIGAWSEDEFYRAVHDGIGRHGEYLYPVMPFPWYAIVTRDDVMAIRAWLMTQPAVHNPNAKAKFRFPYNIRSALGVWREAVFRPEPFKPDPAQSAEVNRGAYLVNGLAHCGECHNSRVLAGSTSKFRGALQGGVVQNWYAPNITSDVRSGIGGWSNTEIATYLKTGSAPGRGVAAGPMAETVHSLSHLTDADLLAIAAYLKTTPAKAEPEKNLELFAGRDARGGDAYLTHCASCHGLDGKGLPGVIPALAGNGSVTSKGPQNVISVVVGGLPARDKYAPMLAIGAGMSDQDIADVTNFVRQNWGNAAPGTAEPGMVAQARKEADTLLTAAPEAGCAAAAQVSTGRKLDAGRLASRAELAAVDEANLPERAQTLVEHARRRAPTLPQADIVNGLTIGYCDVLRADRSVDPRQKALRLGHFSEMVYSAASGHPVAR